MPDDNISVPPSAQLSHTCEHCGTDYLYSIELLGTRCPFCARRPNIPPPPYGETRMLVIAPLYDSCLNGLSSSHELRLVETDTRSPRRDRVTLGDFLQFGYARNGWLVCDPNPPENGPVTIERTHRGRRSRRVVSLDEFENTYREQGWSEYVVRNAPDEVAQCEQCGLDTEPPMTVLGDDTLACDSCMLDTETCVDCNESFSFGQVRELTRGRGYVCDNERGYRMCDDCSEYTEEYSLFGISNGDRVCISCWENYSSCESCGVGMPHDPYSFSSRCDECGYSEDSDEYSEYVQDYSHKPRPRFHGSDSPGMPYLGIEIEVGTDGCYSDAAETAHYALGSLGYLKDDSSITEHYESGFEMVTHPMTHEYARNSFPYSMLDDLRRMGADAQHNGIHVHVSRDGFADEEHTYRWLRFLMSNEDLCIKVARRQGNYYARWVEFDEETARSWARGGKDARRYQAINVQNDATFELRMFRGSLRPNEVRAAFDLTHASVEYARVNESPDATSFVAWLQEQGETYSALLNMIGD